jgi:anti-anti-sigma factor
MAADFIAGADEPDDRAINRCPYSRSFTAAFADDPSCPAYQGTTFTVMDTADRPLRTALTCRHLGVGADARRGGRFYPRCGLGGPQDRLRWVASITPARVAVMRSLEEEFDEATLAARSQLLAANARLRRGTSDAAAVESLEVQLSTFLDRVDAFIDERAARLADVGLEAGQMRELVADWSMAWLRSGDAYGPGVDGAAQRATLAPNAAALLGATLDRPADRRPADAAITRAGALSITRTENPRVLRVSGEVDVAGSDALATALTGALVDGGSVTVDFHEVLFCDISGLRALVRASESAATGQDIHVVGLPAHLHRAVRMVGWSNLPGLIIGAPGATHHGEPNG